MDRVMLMSPNNGFVYRAMRQVLSSYQAQETTLGHLIKILESLLPNLTDVDPDWSRRFSNALADLEEIYAVSIDRSTMNQKALDKAEEIIAEAIECLDKCPQQ